MATEVVRLMVVGTGIIAFLVLCIIWFVLIYKKRYIKHIEEKKWLEAKFNQTILQSQLEIQEQTLKQISQEIHDNIGQALSLAKLNLNLIDPPQVQDTQEKVQDAKLLVSKAIQDLRDISRSFNTDNIMMLGLAGAIQQELNMLKKTGTYEISFFEEGERRELPSQNVLIIFRIVQESIQNILKHAETNRIDAVMSYSVDRVKVIVKDHGKGFHPVQQDSSDPTYGLGIRNMNSRAALIGGSVVIDSIPGKGTTVTIMIPISPAP